MFYEVLGCVIALVGVPALVAAQRCIVWVCLKLWSWRYRLTGHYGLFHQVDQISRAAIKALQHHGDVLVRRRQPLSFQDFLGTIYPIQIARRGKINHTEPAVKRTHNTAFVIGCGHKADQMTFSRHCQTNLTGKRLILNSG